MNPFTILLDGHPFTTMDHNLSPNQILTLGHLEPVASYYLVWLHGKEQTSYQGRGDEIIHLHQKQEFISVFSGPTPVS